MEIIAQDKKSLKTKFIQELQVGAKKTSGLGD